jgi:C-terminal processing protease CtpA/Prc
MTITLGAYLLAAGQTLSKNDREAGRIMLHNIKDSIKKNYYDSSFHGVNLDETFKTADEKINQATSNGQLFGIIAQAVRSLNDSHTNFIPPPHSMRVNYDWQVQIIGDHCYITAVKPGTDAEAKGLKPGDILHVVDGYKITQANFILVACNRGFASEFSFTPCFSWVLRTSGDHLNRLNGFPGAIANR